MNLRVHRLFLAVLITGVVSPGLSWAQSQTFFFHAFGYADGSPSVTEELFERADQECAPNKAILESAVTLRHVGSYGYLLASAEFSCQVPELE